MSEIVTSAREIDSIISSRSNSSLSFLAREYLALMFLNHWKDGVDPKVCSDFQWLTAEEYEVG